MKKKEDEILVRFTKEELSEIVTSIGFAAFHLLAILEDPDPEIPKEEYDSDLLDVHRYMNIIRKIKEAYPDSEYENGACKQIGRTRKWLKEHIEERASSRSYVTAYGLKVTLGPEKTCLNPGIDPKDALCDDN